MIKRETTSQDLKSILAPITNGYIQLQEPNKYWLNLKFYIMQKSHLKAFEINLYGLSYECPYVIRKGNCPLKCVDSLSFKGKVDWLDNLSEERKGSIWEQHITCSQIRNSKSHTVII